MLERIKRFFGIKTYTQPLPVTSNIDWAKWEKDFDELHDFVHRVFDSPLPQPTEEDIENEEDLCESD